MAIAHSYPSNLPVAVIFRLRDGLHQASVLKPVARGMQVQSYALLGYALRTFEFSSALPISTMADIPGEVWVFINGPLESVNHMFLHELVGQAMRSECGLVTGRALDLEGRALPAQQLRFFATRRSFLQQVGGLSVLHAAALHSVFERLALQAKIEGRLIIEAPFAVATFEEHSPSHGVLHHG